MGYCQASPMLTTADVPVTYETLPSAFNTDTTTERYNFPSHVTDLNEPEPSTTNFSSPRRSRRT